MPQPSTTQPSVEQPSTTQLPPEQGPSTIVLGGPLDQDRSELHIAVDPEDPDRMFVVAQGSLPYVALDPQLFWRSEDGGRTWSEPLVMGFIDNTADGAAGDPVVAAGAHGVVLFGTLAVMIEGDPDNLASDLGTITAHIGTRVSTDQAARSPRSVPPTGSSPPDRHPRRSTRSGSPSTPARGPSEARPTWRGSTSDPTTPKTCCSPPRATAATPTRRRSSSSTSSPAAPRGRGEPPDRRAPGRHRRRGVEQRLRRPSGRAPHQLHRWRGHVLHPDGGNGGGGSGGGGRI
jgi:hypothetical protein